MSAFPGRGPGGVPLIGQRAKQEAMREAVAKLATTGDVIQIATKTTQTLGRQIAKDECQKLLTFLIASTPAVRRAVIRAQAVAASGRAVPPGVLGYQRWWLADALGRIRGWGLPPVRDEVPAAEEPAPTPEGGVPPEEVTSPAGVGSEEGAR